MIHIREAEERDAVLITNLSGQLGTDITVDQTIANIALIDKSPYDIAYVAELEGLVVGWVHVFYTTRLETGTFVR